MPGGALGGQRRGYGPLELELGKIVRNCVSAGDPAVSSGRVLHLTAEFSLQPPDASFVLSFFTLNLPVPSFPNPGITDPSLHTELSFKMRPQTSGNPPVSSFQVQEL